MHTGWTVAGSMEARGGLTSVTTMRNSHRLKVSSLLFMLIKNRTLYCEKFLDMWQIRSQRLNYDRWRQQDVLCVSLIDWFMVSHTTLLHPQHRQCTDQLRVVAHLASSFAHDYLNLSSTSLTSFFFSDPHSFSHAIDQLRGRSVIAVSAVTRSGSSSLKERRTVRGPGAFIDALAIA
jgi:hypothetical protein